MNYRLVIAAVTAAAATAVTITPASAAPPARIAVKTDWGIVSVPVVKPPKAGKCVGVTAKVDVRNAANAPDGGINIGIVDDFGNLIAYSEWSSFADVNGKKDVTQSKPNGVYSQPMVACSKAGTWTDPYRPGVTVPLVAVKPKESYTFTVVTSWDHNSEGDADYAFKK